MSRGWDPNIYWDGENLEGPVSQESRIQRGEIRHAKGTFRSEVRKETGHVRLEFWSGGWLTIL